ncbi:hypothetical protein [Streptomyces sp. NPDC086010]|uniref:hypothetical protein n=1 Tax=Streptomyces sp. NPDC086010 TaxID=3365745 RepID=UPI0037CF7AAE
MALQAALNVLIEKIAQGSARAQGYFSDLDARSLSDSGAGGALGALLAFLTIPLMGAGASALMRQMRGAGKNFGDDLDKALARELTTDTPLPPVARTSTDLPVLPPARTSTPAPVLPVARTSTPAPVLPVGAAGGAVAPGSAPGRELEKLLGTMANRIDKGNAARFHTAFTDDAAGWFRRNLAQVLGEKGADDVGRAWATTLLSRYGHRDLPTRLGTVLDDTAGTLSPALRTLLSTGTTRFLDHGWIAKTAALSVSTGGGAAAGVLGEGGGNLAVNGTFTVTGLAAISGAVTGGLETAVEVAAHPYATHLAQKHDLFKDTPLGPAVSPINRKPESPYGHDSRTTAGTPSAADRPRPVQNDTHRTDDAPKDPAPTRSAAPGPLSVAARSDVPVFMADTTDAMERGMHAILAEAAQGAVPLPGPLRDRLSGMLDTWAASTSGPASGPPQRGAPQQADTGAAGDPEKGFEGLREPRAPVSSLFLDPRDHSGEQVPSLTAQAHRLAAHPPDPADASGSRPWTASRGDGQATAERPAPAPPAVPGEPSPAYGGNEVHGTVGRNETPDTTGTDRVDEADAATSARPEPPALRSPWYTEHGMLGEATVTGTAPWTDEQASQATRTVTARITDPRLARAMEPVVAGILALDDAAAWGDELAFGRTAVVDGRLMWVRTVLDSPEAPAEQPPAADVRSYDVRFTSTAAAEEESRRHAKAADLVLLTAVNVASQAASAVVLGAPTLLNEVSQSKSEGSSRTVITGHKLFVDHSNSFTGGVRFRFFADGEEVPQSGDAPVRVERGLAVSFPSVFSGSGEPRPVAGPTPVPTASADGAPERSTARPSHTDEVLNAIDMTPVVAEVHAQLRAAGLGPEDTAAVARQAQQALLTERTARNRSRWWLTSGDMTNTITAGSTGPLGRFRGQLRIRSHLKGMQLLDVTGNVKTRADLGAGAARSSGRGGESLVTAGYTLTATGLAGLPDAPALQQADGTHTAYDPHEPYSDEGPESKVKGVAPMVSATYSSSRGWQRQLSSTPLTHTILTATDPQARYRVGLDIELTWSSSSHPKLEKLNRTASTGGEIGVPWREGRGPAGFEERLLGAVRSPALQRALDASGAGQRTAPGRVGTQPHFRTLPLAPHADASRSVVPPPRLDADRQPRRHDREPLALASRRGVGYGTTASLPGAETIQDSFRARLTELVRERRITAPDWSRIERQLAVYFGRPALEGDLSDLMHGISHTVSLGSSRVTLGLKAHLLDSNDVTTYPMTVNTRAAVGETLLTGLDKGWHVQVGAGGAARFTLGTWGRFQLGGFRLLGRYGRDGKESFASTGKTYRRKENTSDVDEHVVDIAYAMSLHVAGDADPRPEQWWLERPQDLVARIVVPREHVPPHPVTEEEARSAGRLIGASRRWPAHERAFDFSTGASGLYPAFLSLPALTRTIVGLWGRLHQVPQSVIDHPLHWPTEIVRMTRPSALAAYFGMLTSKHGWTIDLPKRDGWYSTVRLRLRGYDPRARPGSDGETEIEQYAQNASRHAQEASRRFSGGLQAAAGPTFRFGSDTGGEAASAAEGPGGRVVAQVHTGLRINRSRSEEKEDGQVDISRATYNGSPASSLADAVFEITVSKSGKGKVVEERPRYLRFDRAMELLAPERRAEDILAPASHPAPPPGDDRPTLASGPVPPPGDDRPTLASGPVPPPGDDRPHRTYLADGRLPRTSAHPEVMIADEVLDAVTARLERRGLLRPLPGDDAVGPADPLRRALEAAFRPDALITKFRSLLGNGVWVWLPVEGFAGSTKYLWVRVSIIEMDPAGTHRRRPEVKLTLRGETLEEQKKTVKRGSAFDSGAIVTARGGERTADEHGHTHGHGGLDLAALRSSARNDNWKDVVKTLTILRANTKDPDGSDEFWHQVRFRIDMGGTRALPQTLQFLADTADSLGGALARAVGATRTWEHFRHEHQPWVWYEDGRDELVEGGVRLLVPNHMTRGLPADETPAAPFMRAEGSNPRWAPPGPRTTTVPEALLRNLHPWDVPAADVVGQWVKTAARSVPREAGPYRSDALRGDDRPDFASPAGLAYMHRTSHEMLRPEIEKLLRGQYEVTVDGRVHHVGFELTTARVLGPQDGIVFKARRYQQIDEDRETSAEQDRSTTWGGGPEAGGGGDESTTTTRTPLEVRSARGRKENSAMAETLEHNKEGVRPFRLFVFDVTVTARPADGRGAPTFEVDVPDGLSAMLPLRDGTLADDLEGHLAGLLAARSPREEPVPVPEPAGGGASTAVVVPSEQKRAALPPVAEEWEDEQRAEADFLAEANHDTDDARWGELLYRAVRPMVVAASAAASSERTGAGSETHVRFRAAPEAVAALERDLLSAGHGARSVVLSEPTDTQEERLLVAVAVRERVFWYDHRTGRAVPPPDEGSGALRSLDLDRWGNVLSPGVGADRPAGAAR